MIHNKNMRILQITNNKIYEFFLKCYEMLYFVVYSGDWILHTFLLYNKATTSTATS